MVLLKCLIHLTHLRSGVDQMLDRGFLGIAQHHPNRMFSFFPAVVRDREKGKSELTAQDIIVSSSKQASDRYTCEVVYNRVKVFDIVKGYLTYKFLMYVTAGWYVAHMFCQFYGPLREPVSWPMRDLHPREAISYGRKVIPR